MMNFKQMIDRQICRSRSAKFVVSSSNNRKFSFSYLPLWQSCVSRASKYSFAYICSISSHINDRLYLNLNSIIGEGKNIK